MRATIDAYKIGVSIAVSSNGDQVLGLLLRRLLGIHGAADLAADKLNKLKIAAVGALSVFAGKAILTGVWDTIKGAEELNKQLERLKLTGVSAADVARARAAAYQTHDEVPTTTPDENVKVLNKLQSQLPNMTDAISVLPDVQRLSYVIQLATGKDSDTSVESAIKFADLTGQVFTKGADGKEAIDPGKFVHMMDMVEKMVTASGGLITPEGLVQFAKQSGLAIRAMNVDQIKYLGEAMIAMGPSRAGTAETSLLSQYAGGTMTAKVAREMTKIGLLKSNEWETVRGGGIVVEKSATRRLADLALNPERFAEVIAEKMTKQGDVSRVDIIAEISRLFGRQTAQRLVGELVTGAPQMQRFAALTARVPSVGDNYKELQEHSLTANLDSLAAAWKGFMQALGEQGIPLAITILQDLTGAIHRLSDAAVANPGIAKFLLDFSAALGAVLVVGGGLAVGSVALGGFASALRLLAPASALFAEGAAGAAGISGLTALLGGLSAAIFAAYAGMALRNFGENFDANHPWARSLDNWLLGDSPADRQSDQDPLARRRALSRALNPTGTWGDDGSAVSGATGSSGAAPTAGPPMHFVPSASVAPPPSALAPPTQNAPGSSPSNPVHVQGSVAVTNGRDLANGVSAQQAKQATKPNAGPTYGDPRSDSPYAGLMGAY